MSGLRDLFGPPSVPDPAEHTGPAVVEDARAEHPHRDIPATDAFTAPEQDAAVQAQHGGPGAPRAVPIVASGTLATRPHPAGRWAAGAANVPEHDTTSGDAVVQLVGRDEWRRRIRVVNTGDQTVYLAPSREQCQPGACYALVADAAVEFDTCAAVYATADTAGASTVTWLATGELARQ